MAHNQSESKTRPSFKEGHYGVDDIMLNGPGCVKAEASAHHPIDVPMEKKSFENRIQVDYAMLKRIQGIHAPMRLMMERKAASEIGRLPFLPSSNLMLDTLNGADETIAFEDIFNVSSESEAMINPHLQMERSLQFM